MSMFEDLLKIKCNTQLWVYKERMRPEIAKIMNFIYPQLQSYPDVTKYPDIKGL
jgi:hypothetical protein